MMDTEKEITDLKARIRKIEDYFKIGIVVAAIFGITGGIGYSVLKGSKKELDKIEERVRLLDVTITGFESIVADGIEKLKSQETESIGSISDKSDKLVRTAVAKYASANSNKKIIRVDDIQICWGTVELNTNGSHAAGKVITFPEPFKETPIVTNAIDAKSSGHAYSIYSHVLTKETYEVNMQENQSARPSTTLIRFDYIAIGKWK